MTPYDAAGIRDAILPDVVGQKEFLPKMLNGSQAKTAFALRTNAETMIAAGGLNAAAFLTLTVGDKTDGMFHQVWDSEEASRRINNLNRRVLKDLFEQAIIVTERHKSGAIHFHVLGIIRGRPDIRTGFDFDRVKCRDYRSVGPVLKGLWEHLREVLPGYGFGRAELTPIRKTGHAVACYVSKYIEKNVCNRLEADKGKKLVRYIGWDKKQLKPNAFSWASQKACAWRRKAKTLAELVGVETREQAAGAFGPRWAHFLTTIWQRTLGDDLRCGFVWTWQERNLLKAELFNASPSWCRKLDAKKLRFSFEAGEIKALESIGWGLTQLRQPEIRPGAPLIIKPLQPDYNKAVDYDAIWRRGGRISDNSVATEIKELTEAAEYSIN